MTQKKIRRLRTVGLNTFVDFYPYLSRGNRNKEYLKDKVPSNTWKDSSWKTKINTTKSIIRQGFAKECLMYIAKSSRYDVNSEGAKRILEWDEFSC